MLIRRFAGSPARPDRCSVEVGAALIRGQEYLLERRLLRRQSTGELIDEAFTQFSYPTGYHYDALRGIDHLRGAGVAPDARVDEAIDVVRSKHDAEGRWPLENPHETELVDSRVRDLEFDMDEAKAVPVTGTLCARCACLTGTRAAASRPRSALYAE